MAKGEWYHEAPFLAPKSTYVPLLFLQRKPFSELALWVFLLVEQALLDNHYHCSSWPSRL